MNWVMFTRHDGESIHVRTAEIAAYFSCSGDEWGQGVNAVLILSSGGEYRIRQTAGEVKAALRSAEH